MFQVFSLDIFHSNMQESDTIMKCVLHSCEVLELDFKITLKMWSFKSNPKTIRATDYSGFMPSAFSSADPALNHQILLLHRVMGNIFLNLECIYIPNRKENLGKNLENKIEVFRPTSAPERPFISLSVHLIMPSLVPICVKC